MHTDEIKLGLGKGWPVCEKMLQREIAKIMAPEIPQEEYVQDVQATMTCSDDEEDESED